MSGTGPESESARTMLDEAVKLLRFYFSVRKASFIQSAILLCIELVGLKDFSESYSKIEVRN
jgi:hypothetical protein